MSKFLADIEASKGRWRDETVPEKGIDPQYYWTGPGRDALEVAYGEAAARPPVTAVREVWRARHGRAAAPLLLVVRYRQDGTDRALVCGPGGDNPDVLDLELDRTERLAATALDKPNRHAALRYLVKTLEADPDQLPGLNNQGLLATHELAEGVPTRPDWDEATQRAKPLLGLRNRDLIQGLGFDLEQRGNHYVLRTGAQQARAVAVFLEESEDPDEPSARFGRTSPVTFAVTAASRENLPWVVAVHDNTLRLYSSQTSGAAGQRSRVDTFVELDLAMLPADRAGYLHLLFSAEALAEGGKIYEIQEASARFAAGLSDRLRERVYGEVVPRLAVAVAQQVGGTDEAALASHYQTTLTILFRLLFVAYGEDTGLLPISMNGDYSDHALKTTAKRLAETINEGRDLGFDNPLTPEIEPTTDEAQTDLWDTCQALFGAVNDGHPRWGVPKYNGGLFSTDPTVNEAGATIAQLSLSNAEFGPALTALLVDKRPDVPEVGPIDFRSLSVREFGTIYEGLLEAELSVAKQDLTLDKDDTYVPAGDDDVVVVPKGNVYLHDRSGARKSSGSYFTKRFAVDHLLDHALKPTLDEHLKKVAEHIEAGREADAADKLFDFRVADISMGSGHFLTAVVDVIEARITDFLTEHPLPPVTAELDKLRNAARNALGELADAYPLEHSSLLRRLIARRCVYGVDANPTAVELARVSLWIHTFVPGLPLSFLNHNLVVGNSLTGIATVEEAVAELTQTEKASKGGKSELRPEGQLSLADRPIEDALERAKKPLQRLANLSDATPEDIEAAREAHREARDAVQLASDLFDHAVAMRLGEASQPTTWSTEDLERFDFSHAREVVEPLDVVHFPVAFPEVFLRSPGGFDVLLGNPPWDKPQVETHEFWGRHSPGLRGLPQKEKEAAMKRLAAERPDLAEQLEQEKVRAAKLKDLIHTGPYDLGVGHADLAQVFAWRFWHLLRERGRFGVVFPRAAVLSSPGMESWRGAILQDGAFDDTCLLENKRHWVFDDVDVRYTVGLVTVRRGGAERTVRFDGPHRSRAEYDKSRATSPATMSADEFTSLSAVAAFPVMNDPDDLPVVRKMLLHPRIGDDERPDWQFRPLQGDVNSTNAKKEGLLQFDDAKPAGYWPVYGGSSFYLWAPETGETYAWTEPSRIQSHLFERRKRQANHARSAFYGFADAVITDPKTLPSLRPRLAFRDVARATDSRSMIVSLIPPHVVLQHTAPYLLRVRADERDEAYLLGVLSSRVFDWLLRSQVEAHVTFSLFGDQPVPGAGKDHPGRQRVIEIAGRLAAIDDRYSDWAKAVGVPVGSVKTEGQRHELLVELEACVARLYGLDEDDIRHIYKTFHATWDPADFTTEVLAAYAQLDFDPAEVPE